MASSVLHHDTSLKDHFQTAGPYIMTSDKTVSFRPVSYSPRAEKQRTAPSTPPGRPRIPLERRSTVHFDDETAPNELPEAATPAETMVSTGTKTGSYGSNRSASRSSVTEPAAPAIANRPVQPSLEVYEIRELTAVDKKWGCLFDIDNQPTERFREAMHSLARYIIRAFPSSDNIVLVPAKLASFYNFHGVDSDPFCYKFIFQSGDRDLNRRVADLYQDLGCSYHLVQARPGLQPRIPGLTPDGFTRWMALHLQAFPDGVSQRLDRVISDFPLDVVSPLDGRTERLPKQLSRYLLPRVPDGRIRSLLQQAVKRHFGQSALLTFSVPDEKSSRLAPYTIQSCPTSPAHRKIPSPSASTTAVSQGSHRDGRDVRTPKHVHRASDPGTASYDNDEKVLPLVHRRHASYPGPQSRSGRGSELVHDNRGHREHDRVREESRHRSPSRSRSSRHDSRHSSPAPSERKEDVRRSHHRQHSLRDVDNYRSLSQDGRPRSSSRSSHSGIANSTSNGSGWTSGTTGGGGDGRRSKYPPSPLSMVHPSLSRSTNPSPARDGARLATATNAFARRAPSPKAHSFRVFLPEIHYTDRRRQSATREGDLARDAMEHSAKINRRASCFGPPATAEDEGHRFTDREHGHGHRMERRASSYEEQNYRLYGSPISSTPIFHYNSTAGARETAAKAHAPVQVKADVPPVPASLSSPRVFPTRPPVSLAATVTSLEDGRACIKEDDGNGSDQTWEDYLRSSPRVAPVA